MIFITVLDDGRVGAATTEERFAQGMTQVQEPEEFDFGSFSPKDWVYEEGNLKYDPLPEPEPPEDPVKIANDAKGIAEEAKAIAEQAGTDPQVQTIARLTALSIDFASVTATDVVSIPDYIPEWADCIGKQLKQNDPVKYEGVTYRCSQAVTVQKIYPPDVAGESQYYPIEIAPDGIIVYRTCHGAYDQVLKGEKRHYPDADGPVYEALENTAYSPDAYPQHWKLREE